jgi:competence protein ComEC
MKIWKYFLGFLILVAAAVWLAVFSFSDQNLHLIACDVGQGDAILATYGNIQILTDGGPNNKVLDCLAKHMPFWDRKIEAVILTHPEHDHYGGLVEVFRRYQVENFFTDGLESSSSDYEVLKNLVGGRGVKMTNLRKGMSIRFDLISLDIFNPEEIISGEEKDSVNDQGVVSLLIFGNFKAILTADVGKEILEKIAQENSIGPVNYLKISHHGSKTGTSLELLDLLQPQMAVISVGRNSYGHPAEEVLDLLKDKGIKILRTDEVGNIEIISDGNVVK